MDNLNQGSVDTFTTESDPSGSSGAIFGSSSGFSEDLSGSSGGFSGFSGGLPGVSSVSVPDDFGFVSDNDPDDYDEDFNLDIHMDEGFVAASLPVPDAGEAHKSTPTSSYDPSASSEKVSPLFAPSSVLENITSSSSSPLFLVGFFFF